MTEDEQCEAKTDFKLSPYSELVDVKCARTGPHDLHWTRVKGYRDKQWMVLQWQ